MVSMCVSSCRRCLFVPVVHSVAILSAVICSLLMFVSDAIGDHMVETYSSMGLVMALDVARIVSFCFPHVVDVSALIICIVLRAFVVVISMCLLYVSLGSSQVFFGVDVHGECDVVYLLFKLCAVFCCVWCEESACCFVWVENEVVCLSPCMYFM